MRHGILGKVFSLAKFCTVFGAVIAVLGFAPLANAGASFKTLSEIMGVNFDEYFYGWFSEDESTIVGNRFMPGNPVAFRWTKAGGLQSFPSTTEFPWSAQGGVSKDGSVIAVTAYGGAYARTFLWVGNEVMALNTVPSGVTDSTAHAVSGDGSAVVGYNVLADGRLEAFRWTRLLGMRSLGALDTNSPLIPQYSMAYDVSNDGSVVVGHSSDPKASTQAFRWTEAGGIIGLGYPQGAFTSSAEAVSADGSVIAGFAQYDNGNGNTYDSAFRWTASKGMQAIPELTGFQSMSADGKILFGGSYLGGLRWTEKGGARRIHEIFAIYGIDIPDRDLNNLSRHRIACATPSPRLSPTKF